MAGRGSRSKVPVVFISYRREDSGDITGRIRDHIATRLGHDHVFMDIDSIPLGADFRSQLAESVGRADVVLAVIGRDWLTVADESGRPRLEHEDDYVRLELEAALQREIPVVPVLVLGAQPLSTSQLPASLQGLAFRQSAFVRRDPDFHPDMRRLVDGLLGVEPAPEPMTPGGERRDGSRASSRRFVVTAIGAGVLVAAAAGIGIAVASNGDTSGGGTEAAKAAVTIVARDADCYTTATCYFDGVLKNMGPGTNGHWTFSCSKDVLPFPPTYVDFPKFRPDTCLITLKVRDPKTGSRAQDTLSVEIRTPPSS
jgi:hypothetical protein